MTFLFFYVWRVNIGSRINVVAFNTEGPNDGLYVDGSVYADSGTYLDGSIAETGENTNHNKS